MDVSDQGSHEGETGEELIQTLVELTGIPEPLIQKQLGEILGFAGKDASSLTLDQLRQALLIYLEALHQSEESSSQVVQLRS